MQSRRITALLAALVACCALLAAAAEVAGTRPSYLDKVTESVPNAAAIGRRIWVPGLEEGYVPQGLTIAEGGILVSA